MKDGPGSQVLDLGQIADNLVPAENGIWVSAGHQDLRFIESDDTDWARIEETSYWYAHRNRCFLALIGLFPPRGAIFEIGAGNGSVALALQGAGHSVVAIEPTVRLAVNARNRGLKNVVCSGLENAGFKRGTLSNVGMFDVIEHISADVDYLKKLRHLMPSNGRLYCAVPAWQFLWSREDEAADHVRRYSLSELQEKISNAGFALEHSTYYFAALFVPILLLRAVPSRLGLRRPRTAESSMSEHTLRPGFVSRIIQVALDLEVNWIASARRCVIGASCAVVARAI